MTTPPTVNPGDPVLASDLDTLLLAADERLAKLYGGRSWFAFGVTPPSQQVPLLGALYVLSADSERHLIPPPGGGLPDGRTMPARYDHAAHVAAGNAMTLMALDDEGVAWEVSGDYLVDNYIFGESASILTRTATVPPDTEPRTLPLRWVDAFVPDPPIPHPRNFEPERFWRYAVADVFIEDTTGESFSWPFDKFGVLRVHNLSPVSKNVSLGPAMTLGIPARSVRVVRKTSRSASWQMDKVRTYLPACLSGDVPSWDWRGGIGTIVSESQRANPVFRVCLLQSMFRPQTIQEGPGMFSSTIVPVLPEVGTDKPLSDALAQPGIVEVVRTADYGAFGTVTEQIPVPFDGSLLPTPGAWANVGLAFSQDDSQRGVAVDRDPAYPLPVDDEGHVGTWNYEFISRTSNVTHGIILGLDHWPTGQTYQFFRPFFSSVTDADEFYKTLFSWPDGPSEIIGFNDVEMAEATWVPMPGSAFGDGVNHSPDYLGTWETTSGIVVRSYTAGWSSWTPGSTLAPWNIFTATVDGSRPTPGGALSLNNVKLVRGVVHIALTFTETTSWHHARTEPEFDDETFIDPAPEEFGGIERYPTIQGRHIGLGQLNGATYTEPRWNVFLLPTIGADPQRSWEAMGFYSSEDWVWTPLYRDYREGLAGHTTLYHWRVTEASGAPDGKDWGYSTKAVWTGSTARSDPDTYLKSEVHSGMLFWRVFWLGDRQPGTNDPYPGGSQAGVHPWPIRDHGWLADFWLGSDPATRGSWLEARHALWDWVPMVSGASGNYPDEWDTGMQIRMAAQTFNQVSALVAGMTHVREVGFEHFVDGFTIPLFLGNGWSPDGWWTMTPVGCVYTFGAEFHEEDDALMRSLGVATRFSDAPELETLKTITRRRYVNYLPPGGWTLETLTEGDRPPGWVRGGEEIEWVHIDDLDDALRNKGWNGYQHAFFAHPVEPLVVIPSEGMESFVTQIQANMFPSPADGIHFRFRLDQSVCIPKPVESSAKYQWVRGYTASVAIDRLVRTQVLGRVNRVEYDPSMEFVDVYNVNPPPEVLPLLERYRGEFRYDSAGNGAAAQEIGYNAMVLAPSSSGTHNVLVLPWRRQICIDRTPDASGPPSQTEVEYNRTLTLPAFKPAFAVLGSPQAIIPASEFFGASPTFPEDAHECGLYLVPKVPHM